MTYAGCRLSGMIPGFDGFTSAEASSIGIIGGADGPTAIFVTSRLAPHDAQLDAQIQYVKQAHGDGLSHLHRIDDIGGYPQVIQFVNKRLVTSSLFSRP